MRLTIYGLSNIRNLQTAFKNLHQQVISF
ncbi:protein of unknown function (plasmid) [Azospirillum baldaniorum]|uniref:Uncharacterized protein n=1 Tax=Azospirillum baldaniorum TaxID=1064539 RepID=A0A9P1K0I7_9PROT|nr:protein of unknown function [Azospirillum baldaniorum]